MGKSFQVEPARPSEYVEALGLLFQQEGAVARDARIRTGLELLERGELDPAGVLVARGREGLLGALLCCPVPGAGALIWPPQTRTPGSPDLEDLLVCQGLAWLRACGVRLVQAFLLAAEAPRAAPLLRNGLELTTQLVSLRHDLNLLAPSCHAEARLACESYRDGDRALFHATLLRSYEGTLDCPEVNGIRTLEQILEGHQTQGIHHPEQWWLARQGGEAVGVLILSEMPENAGWDVSYVGVIAEARGRGIGQALMAKALQEARAVQTAQLTLAVDVRNQPALKLYDRLGFLRYDERDVYLGVLGAG